MLPLAGVKVVEIAENLAGPYAGQILALMGADVLKVERPEGDNARGWGPPFLGGMATTFHAMNLNKSGATLDFRNEDDFAWLVERIGQSDVVVQNISRRSACPVPRSTTWGCCIPTRRSPHSECWRRRRG